MHVVVVGAGAVGTLYGGWLLQGGAEVSFLARGAALAALGAQGLALRGARGDWRGGPVRAAEHAADLPPADVLLLAIKLYDLERAALAARDLLKPGGLVVGLQNGVETAEVLGRVFAPGQIMVGPVYSAARLTAPGEVDYAGESSLVALGSLAGSPHLLAEVLVDLWRKAGVEARIEPDIRTVLWTKFLVFASNLALTCLTRQPAGVVYHDPDLLALARRSIDEILAVARAEGVELPASAAADTLAILTGFPPEVVASMRQDLDSGRPLELEGASGAVVRLGGRHGVATPFHEMAYACLKPYRDGASPAL